MKNINLSIIIPCYNEEKNIKSGVLDRVNTYLAAQKYSWEVIIIDDGSNDDSVNLLNAQIKKYSHFSLLRKKHQGKAQAVTAGIFKASGKYIVFTDLDQATPISQIEVIMPWFAKGFDVVIGSRNNQREGAPFFRLAMARGFMALRNIILNLNIYDTQCGFKGFTRNAALAVFSNLRVFGRQKTVTGSTVTAGFDVELLYITKTLGYKIKEVPVKWHYKDTRHINPVKDSVESFMDLLRIKSNSIRGKYNIS